MKKTLIIVRHGRKDGDLISQAHLEEINNSGIPGVNEYVSNCHSPIFLHLGSSFLRTEQTILAFKNHLDREKINIQGLLPADPRFGNENLFNKFLENPAIKAEADKTTWFDAYSKRDKNFIAETQLNMSHGVYDLFKKAEDDSLTISIGHTPLIEWLAFAFDSKNNLPRDLKLKELTGIILTEKDGDRITISGTIGF